MVGYEIGPPPQKKRIIFKKLERRIVKRQPDVPFHVNKIEEVFQRREEKNEDSDTG